MSLANDSASILDAALALPPSEREALVRKLVISLDADQPKHADYDRLWGEEIQRRGDALQSGKDPGLDDVEARRRIHEAAQRGRKS
jgi:putative addiction module component (TIGR02574 family)